MLHEKIAIITGAAAGIGEATALYFAESGASVVALDRDEQGIRQVAARIEAAGGQALAVTADVSNRSELSTAVEAALARFGRIDILINNAGIYPRKAFLEITEAEWDRMHDINLKGTFHMTQLVGAHMVRQGHGKIVNISSVTFFMGAKLLSHYVAAKGGVIGLTRVLAKELGEHNIHVNCITPGAIQTDSEKFFVTEEQSREFVALQSLKRRLQPVEIAKVCAFLASPMSDAMTGQTLNVDAGWILY
ncbi:MAG: SDR family NAD(P)-dependent oxidoreductase [Bryobacteraceae bacterium]|nr:SDR family NAD(P)-dependent oxidoreductase [Bryobacteraceae bacterium]